MQFYYAKDTYAYLTLNYYSHSSIDIFQFSYSGSLLE